MQIREVLADEGADVVHAPPDASVADLVALLREHNLGAVVVSPDGDRVAGIVSERDPRARRAPPAPSDRSGRTCVGEGVIDPESSTSRIEVFRCVPDV